MISLFISLLPRPQSTSHSATVNVPAAKFGLKRLDTGRVYPLPKTESWPDAYLAAADAWNGRDVGLLLPPPAGVPLKLVLLPRRTAAQRAAAVEAARHRSIEHHSIEEAMHEEARRRECAEELAKELKDAQSLAPSTPLSRMTEKLLRFLGSETMILIAMGFAVWALLLRRFLP